MATLKTSYGSPRWSGEILDCSMPMTFDQFSRCSYDCCYCFSAFQRMLKHLNPSMKRHFNSGKNYLEQAPESVNVTSIKKMFTLERESQFSDYIRQRIPMQWGGLSDPFDMFEKKYGIGLELLEFFHELQYPICFSTKGTWWTQDERYRQLFKGSTWWNVKFSIITMEQEAAKIVERGVPSPQERVDAVRRFTKELSPNGGATLRLRPFIIGLSDRTMEEIITKAANAGATALSTEFFCLEDRCHNLRDTSFDSISEIVGFDIRDFYKKYSVNRSGYLRLNPDIKKPYIDKMEKLCKKHKMRFYVSDAHHKDRCANGSCCGLSGDWNYFRGQYTEMLSIAKSRNDRTVQWQRDMVPELKRAGLDKFLWRNACGFNTRSELYRKKRYDMTMMDWIHETWNDPTKAQAPYKYFHGLLRPHKVDKNGDVVYKYYSYEEGGK